MIKTTCAPHRRWAPSWDLGTIAASDFKKIAAQRTLPISVYTKNVANAEGEEALTNITSNPGLSFKLKRDGVDLASGEDADYVVQCNSVVLSKRLRNEGNFERLSLEVSTSDSLKLTGTTVASQQRTGRFRGNPFFMGQRTCVHECRVWGRSRVFLSAGPTRMRGCVVDSYTSVEWPDGQETPIGFFLRASLKAGNLCRGGMQARHGALCIEPGECWSVLAFRTRKPKSR